MNLENIYAHKIGYGALSIGGAVTGTAAERLKDGIVQVKIYTWHIPPVIIETFQTLAYAGSFVLTVLTVSAIVAKKYNAWKKKRAEQK